MKVGSQDPVLISLCGADNVRIANTEIASLRVIYKYRLGIAVFIFIELSPYKSILTVSEENFLITA